MIVAVAGAGGRMGGLVAQTIADAPEMELGPLYDPRCRIDGGRSHDR